MKRITTLFVVVTLGYAVVSGGAWAQIPDDQLQKIVTYEFGQSREPLTVVADHVREALASPEQRKAVAAQLTALLGADATRDCKQFICRQLAVAGGPDNVPAIAALLESEETADMARYALEPIPGPAAAQALIDALAKTGGKVKVGIINSLGARKCPKSVAALAPLATDADAVVAEVAIAALGKIANDDAVQALAAAKGKVADELEMVLADSYLLCADRMLEQGDAKGAEGIYGEMFAPSEPARIRVAALQGLVAARGEAGVALVVEVLTGDDAVLQGVATGLVRKTPGEAATKAFAKQLPKLAPEGQVRLVSALADRGDKAALSAVAKAAESKDDAVRMAGLAALAKLGDASCVKLLAQTAANTTGRERDTARKSLYALQGEDVDAAILENMVKAKADIATELIRSTVERNLTAAVPQLMDAVRAKDEDVQVAALRALGELAQPDSMPALVNELVRAKGDATRAEAEKAVVAVGRKVEDANQRAGATLDALNAADGVQVRCSLLKVLGELGDPAALEAIRAAGKDADDADVQDAAIRALAQWPDVAVLDDVLAITKSTDNQTHKVLALRGYVRLLALPSDRPGAETIAKYEEALELAARADEKKAVLAGLANVNEPGALKLAEPFLADEQLQAEAIAACLKVGKAICGAYPGEVEAVINKVLEIAKDDEVKKQAKEIIDAIHRFEGYVTAWQVSGPYTQEGKDGSALFDIAFPPEDPNAKDVTWQVMPANTYPDKPWLMGLDKFVGGSNRAAYLRTTVVSPKAQDALAELGSDDGVKVWLNGELVHANNASRGCNPGEDKFNVKLKEGENALMLKVTQGGSQWAACIRLRTPDGGELENVKAELN